MGWLCLTARRLALLSGAGAAMAYRLIMFISGFFCYIPTLTYYYNYSLSQNGWDTLGSPCPLNLGVQDLVTKPRSTTLRGTRGARERKKQRLVKVSQLFLSETVSGRNLKAC